MEITSDSVHLLSDVDSRDDDKKHSSKSRREESDDDGFPESATSPTTAWLHLLTFLLTCVILRTLILLDIFEDDPIGPALFLIFVCGSSNIFVDLYFFKVHKRASTGLDFHKFNPSVPRTLIKSLGLAATFASLFFLYWVLPEYSSSFYSNYYDMLWFVLPISIPFAIAYIFYVDGFMTNPHDGYYNFGLLCICRWEGVAPQMLMQHVLGWVVKGFFLPLMFVPLCEDIEDLLGTNFKDFSTWGDYYGYIYSFLYFIDLHFANIGYIMTFRLTDTHIRAVEPTLLGWLVALMCYSPINNITSYYFEYTSDVAWGEWLEGLPVIQALWGTTILILTAMYTLSAVYFGIRFSNLTNRGIITSGPYTLTKHPAYLFKNLSWWMVSIPFVTANGTIEDAVKNCFGLLFFNGIYILRARAEEHLLSADPAYVRYCRHMERHGIFASISEQFRRTPYLSFLLTTTTIKQREDVD